MTKNFEKLDDTILFWSRYVLFDSREKECIDFFAKRGLRVKINHAYEKEGKDFIFVFCSVRKKDEGLFEDLAMQFASYMTIKKGFPYEEWCLEMQKVMHPEEKQ